MGKTTTVDSDGEFINPETGEVLHLVGRAKHTEVRESELRGRHGQYIESRYIFTFAGVWERGDLSAREIRTLFALTYRTKFDQGIGIYQATEVGAALGFPPELVSRLVTSLAKKGYIVKTGRGAFELNPEYTWLGKLSTRKKMLILRGINEMEDARNAG